MTENCSGRSAPGRLATFNGLNQADVPVVAGSIGVLRRIVNERTAQLRAVGAGTADEFADHLDITLAHTRAGRQ